MAIVLGIVASYTGMITDPIQKSLGWHDKKLHRLIDALGNQLQQDNNEDLSYKDAYAARILDLADLLLSVAGKLNEAFKRQHNFAAFLSCQQIQVIHDRGTLS